MHFCDLWALSAVRRLRRAPPSAEEVARGVECSLCFCRDAVARSVRGDDRDDAPSAVPAVASALCF